MGAWRLRTHVQASIVRTNERGPRGDSATFSVNHAMVTARRPARGGVFGVQSMWSLEPLMGRAGYPLLTQTGETSDGTTPLIDRQHPHDLPMELAFTYARALDGDRGLFAYLAPVGAPALGPPPFMHRASGARLPVAPITHHWLDSTHVSFGVLTGGFIASPAFKMEVSGFNGREPDHRRWGLEAPRLDSYAFRVSVNPTASLALQLSAGFLNEPEQAHPGADLARVTVSAMYARPGPRVGIDATVAWGQNKRSTASIPVTGGFLVFPGVTSQAALGEATIRIATQHALIGRVEHAKKPELFPLDDPRHNVPYRVVRATIGYAVDLLEVAPFTVAVGAAGSWTRVDRQIKTQYDGPPSSVLAFVEIRTR